MNGDRNAYVESDNSGVQTLVMYDQQGNTDVLELGSDISRAELSERLLTYLG
jgi:hypothetical protein